MLFIATLQHSPADCFARPENAEAFEQAFKIWDNFEATAESLGITLLGSYINPNEHLFYFIMDTDQYYAITQLLGSVMLTHHTAKIIPVHTLRQAVDAVKRQRAQQS
jgi:hypothetical protein